MVRKYSLLVQILLLLTEGSLGDEKLCRFMNPREGIRIVDRSAWNALSGLYCYSYLNKTFLKFKYYTTKEVNINGTIVNGTSIDNSTYFLYDYKDPIALSYIRSSFREDYLFQRWMTCAREAENCCDNLMTSENIYPTSEYSCPAVWDSWACWLPAKADTVSKQLCPEITFSSPSRACELQSERQCLAEGGWAESTNYNVCAWASVLRDRLNFHVIFLAVTASLAFPAVVIFFAFSKFRQKLLFVLHRNLIVALIIRSIFTIMTKEMILKDDLISVDADNTMMARNSIDCRVLAFFENVAKNGIFACMLVDGFYLHQTIVRPFATKPSSVMLYIVVLVLSLVPSLIWALLRGIHGGANCWMVDNSGDQWVSDGLRFAILGVNTLLLLDIIRVLIMKLRKDGISQQARTTLRITLFLIPLFGIHIIVTANRDMVPDNSCSSLDVYYYFTYALEGIQAIAVSLLFCYMNSEVYEELRNATRKIMIRFESPEAKLRRRPTTATVMETIPN